MWVPYYLEKEAGLEVRLRVQPKASRTQLEGERDGQLRLRLTAPPVENAANQAIVEFFAKLLGVPKSKVEIRAGHKSRDKVIFVEGDAARLRESLLNAVQ